MTKVNIHSLNAQARKYGLTLDIEPPEEGRSGRWFIFGNGSGELFRVNGAHAASVWLNGFLAGYRVAQQHTLPLR